MRISDFLMCLNEDNFQVQCVDEAWANAEQNSVESYKPGRMNICSSVSKDLHQGGASTVSAHR